MNDVFTSEDDRANAGTCSFMMESEIETRFTIREENAPVGELNEELSEQPS
jgi:hypothetical protein